ncbi:anti-anti-sigma factor [Gracilibacillus ureilyticus]|uniref:Anti-sigma factor antagonist n=1 Tax=Gracilibacillus ureilyticus TaxID=531814 RepID=A0A1H9TQV0_9BACI|nr:STAS domain-containing protein [Gracilibacillus ureilyticus]SER99023.1 anti-anti-sigma factor [Gracilibacillus ureilyticus]
MLEYQVKHINDRCTVLLAGDLDFDSTEKVAEDLAPQILQYESIQLDFQKVNFVDSSGMGLLIQLVTTLKDNDKEIKIVNVNKDILEVFELVQMPEIIGHDVMEDN